MSLLNPAGLWLLGLAIPIILLHILRPRRDRQEVSSTYLWEELTEPVAAASPWQRLRPNLLLFLQLAAVAALTAVVAHPVMSSPSPLAPHTVFIIDASGSMLAVDGSPDRTAAAADRAKELRRTMPTDGLASVVVASNDPRIALNASGDVGRFDDVVDAIETLPSRADYESASELAETLRDRNIQTGFVFISDGAVENNDAAQLPAGTRFESVGDMSTNRSINTISLDVGGGGNHGLVVVENHGDQRVRQRLRIDVDGETIDSTELEIGAGEIVEHSRALPAGERVSAYLDGEDLLAHDNSAHALIPTAQKLKVLWVGPDNTFLDALFAGLASVEIDRSATVVPTEDHDIAIYDRVDPPAEPSVPFLVIAPPSGIEGVEVTGEVEAPIPSFVSTDDSIVANLDLSEVAIAYSQRLEASTARALVGSEETSLILTGTSADRTFVYLGFGIEDSNLGLQVAFPRLGARILASLAGDVDPTVALRVGNRAPGLNNAAAAVGPGEIRIPYGIGSAPPKLTRPGFWRVVDDEGDALVTLAVNADTSESNLRPQQELEIRPPGDDDKTAGATSQTSIRWWFLVGAAALILAEQLLARRLVGVPRWQRNFATIGRGLAIGALLIGMLSLAIPRQGKEVATLFLVDASDSLTDAGKQEALDFAKAAIEERPDDAKSAVVLFGGDARMELPLGDDTLGDPRVVVDPSQTDVASAMRLAQAILPGDYRRRVVLVSDGRPTTGDAAEEARQLSQHKIGLDVHTISPQEGADVAVTRIDAPNEVREGEQITIDSTIVSTADTDAVVTLKRDSQVIEQRTVAVTEGQTRVEFTDSPESDEIARYEVEVSAAGDVVADNDSAYVAVQGADLARVLIVEGTEDEGQALVAALNSSGIDTEVVTPQEMPALEELAQYASIALVDVDERLLSSAQVKGLSTAVRDLGKGLVTIGGPRAYGPGNYLDTQLEEILPVISEITDPERRKSVAQVLTIDTSESMGACHCAEEDNFDSMMDGGVNKTDISRAGAKLAIDAMGEGDEVGVVAFDDRSRWVIELQENPSQQTVDDGLATLRPAGGTQLRVSLVKAAEALRDSDAAIKHIVLFTDGFTEGMDVVASEAGALYEDEGITVSVVGTGEGAATELEAIAKAGGGRFYPGRDLQSVPEILVQETFVASRNFIQEGTFLPEVTSIAAPVRNLSEAPTLGGFVGTTAKDQATTSMRIGEDRDPLLASMQVGLGRSVAWTSDATGRWSQAWLDWEGYVNFWSTVVKDTFPTAEGASISASVSEGTMRIEVEGPDTFETNSTAVATISSPEGNRQRVLLDRVDATTFAGVADVAEVGSYGVGVTVTDADGTVTAGGSVLANQSYSLEYRPGVPNPAVLETLSQLAGGRGEITSDQAFDQDGLEAGEKRWSLTPWLVALAIALWLASAIFNRVPFRKPPGAEDQSWGEIMGRSGRERLESWRARRRPEPGWVRSS